MVKDIENYKIASASTIDDLEQLVLNLMGAGWVPQGGVSSNGLKYWQALVK